MQAISPFFIISAACGILLLAVLLLRRWAARQRAADEHTTSAEGATGAGDAVPSGASGERQPDIAGRLLLIAGVGVALALLALIAAAPLFPQP